MIKKILFIQPFYFYIGHYFQAFNNLIINLKEDKRFSFLVSIKKNDNNKNFYKDFSKISKLTKIYTFKSSKKVFSKINIIKSFWFIITKRKNYKVFFFYDCIIFSLTYLFFFTKFLFKSNYIFIYAHYGPEFIDKSIIKKFFLKSFLKNNNTRIYLRTKELQRDWKKKLPNFKNKIFYLKSIDYPNYENFKLVNKTNKLKLGCVGQIRNGKSLNFLNKFFTMNKKYSFKIIGGYADIKSKNEFQYLNKKFLSNSSFIDYKTLINYSKKLDYIILLYDYLFDKRYEVSTLYLAAKLNIPVICFNNNSWLSKKISYYKCGILINDLSEFNNFPERHTKKYKNFLKNLKKFNRKELNLSLDIKKLKFLF